MKRYVFTVLVLGLLTVFATNGCGGGSAGQKANNWDEMDWDAGTWQ